MKDTDEQSDVIHRAWSGRVPGADLLSLWNWHASPPSMWMCSHPGSCLNSGCGDFRRLHHTGMMVINFIFSPCPFSRCKRAGDENSKFQI